MIEKKLFSFIVVLLLIGTIPPLANGLLYSQSASIDKINDMQREPLVPQVLWYYNLSAPSFGSAATADIDHDGNLEIVFGTYFNDENIYALNAENGTLLWKYDTGGCNDASPVIADVDLDGDLEVVVPASSPCRVYCFNGSTGAVEWSRSTSPNSIDSPPAVADVDNDGKPEIIFGAFYGYVYCLNGENGSVQWRINLGTNSYIQSEPNILDVDLDGQLDVVVSQWAGTCRVYALNGSTGATKWFTDQPNDYMYHGCSFADIDEDGKPELAIGCYDNHVYVFNAENGGPLWNYPTTYYVGAPTSIADLDNDNHLEIVYAAYTKIGVLSHTGGQQWSYSAGGGNFRGIAIADVDGNHILDVAFGADDGILRVLRGDNGGVVWTYNIQAHYGRTFEIDHAPIIADFNNDGKLDIFIIGGYGISSPPTNNHGRAYLLSAGDGTEPGWPMFRHDIHHSGNFHYLIEPPVVYVDDNYDPSTPGWQFDHFNTIQDGVDAVIERGTVHVYNGMYTENVIVNKTINLLGEQRETTIIDGHARDDTLLVLANKVNISGFTLQNCGVGWEDAGLDIHSNNNSISNNTIQNNPGEGTILSNANNNTIIDNIFTDNVHDAIMVRSSSDNIISNNQIILNPGNGVFLYDAHRNTLVENDIYENEGTGIVLQTGSSQNIINYNMLSQNLIGILADQSFNNLFSNNTIDQYLETGVSLGYSTQNTITNNTIRFPLTSGIGISLYVCDNTVITGNSIQENTDGIELWLSSENQIIGNLIDHQEIGLHFGYSSYNLLLDNTISNSSSYGLTTMTCEDNYFYHNNFMNNMQQVNEYDTTNTWDNGYPSGGNYWDDYSGVDNNHGPNQDIPGPDGIGDIPYLIPPQSNQDTYPFMKPTGWRYILTGSVYYQNQSPVFNITVEISNLNTGMKWCAHAFDNIYSLQLYPGSDFNVGDMLRFIGRDTHESVKVYDYQVTTDDINNGTIIRDLILDIHYRDLKDFPFYLSQIDTGAMTMKMMMDYLMWNQTMNPEGPPDVYNEQTLYNTYKGTDNIINGSELTSGLNNEIDDYGHGWIYGYFFSPYASTNANDVLKQICIWLDYPVNYYNNIRDVDVPKPGHPNHVPIAIPTGGNYNNWMTIRGIHTDRNAWLPPTQLNVYGFWLNDPKAGGLGANTYVTTQRFLSTYFLNLTVPGDLYNGKRLAITDPSRDILVYTDQVTVTIAEPATGFTKTEMKLVAERSKTTTTKPIDNLVIHAAAKAAKTVLQYDSVYSPCFENTRVIRKPVYNKDDTCTVFFDTAGLVFEVQLYTKTGALAQIVIKSSEKTSEKNQ
ncbi:MAG: right-handed parallel beta-helix repeat-containing protein [Methanobacteriota archaeon]